MEPRLLLFSLLFLLFSTLFAFQVIWLLRQLKQYLNGGSAKNVYVINYDNNTLRAIVMYPEWPIIWVLGLVRFLATVMFLRRSSTVSTSMNG